MIREKKNIWQANMLRQGWCPVDKIYELFYEGRYKYLEESVRTKPMNSVHLLIPTRRGQTCTRLPQHSQTFIHLLFITIQLNPPSSSCRSSFNRCHRDQSSMKMIRREIKTRTSNERKLLLSFFFSIRQLLPLSLEMLLSPMSRHELQKEKWQLESC